MIGFESEHIIHQIETNIATYFGETRRNTMGFYFSLIRFTFTSHQTDSEREKKK